MSDFDKEAERQRLREKYEKDAERREETQRMSELLLQGATMTNKHCNQCGTPIFRYQGTEFCPNCQNEQANAAAETADAAAADVVDGEAESASSDGVSAATSASDEESAGEAAQSVPTPEPERDVPSEVSGTGGASGAETANAGTTNAETANPRTGASGGGGVPTGRAASTETGVEESAATESAAAATAPAAEAETAKADASMRDARESLLRAITEHARRSTATEEPQQAAAHLQAAREAAEALDALDR